MKYPQLRYFFGKKINENIGNCVASGTIKLWVKAGSQRNAGVMYNNDSDIIMNPQSILFV